MDNQNELFVIVNEHDKLIGYRSRYDCHHHKKLIHRAIGIVVFNNKGEVLLQKRSSTKDTDPGLYTLSASGHVSQGETYRQAAEREFQEELGIKTHIKFTKKFLVKMDKETEMDAMFITKHNGPFKINRDELDEVKFFSPKQIKKILPKLSIYALICLRKMNII